MADYIFPLTYKPGLNRDGTDFQPEYCSDGQWIRFNEGKVQKIGGMVSPGPIDAELDASYVSDIRLVPSGADNSKIFAYISGDKLAKLELKTDFSSPIINKYFKTLGNLPANLLWQTTIVIDDNVRKILFLASDNAGNIAQSTKCKLYQIATTEANVNVTEIDQNSFDNKVSGGMCYATPYLFLYGENGHVQYSDAGKPLNFNGDNSLTISNDKVIYGAPIRGGSNSPSLLFWTLSKVVRLTNTSEDEAMQLQVDVVSNSSSILSSRCVVEYDGLFFWVGTDRFFVYNGVVQEMVNNSSINYFFDNIDNNHKQKVFGVINPRFGEIWWYYPEKGQDQENVINTRALIYNKRENSWYDTAISRECGIFSSDLGSVVTYGKSLTGELEQKYLWKHEVGANEVAGKEEDEDTYINNGIASSVTTPFISQAAFNAQNPMNGVDRFLELRRIEPDFVMNDPTKEITVRINAKRYAQSNLSISDPITFTGQTEKIDTREQGRVISFTFASEHDFRIGNIMLLLASGDGN